MGQRGRAAERRRCKEAGEAMAAREARAAREAKEASLQHGVPPLVRRRTGEATSSVEVTTPGRVVPTGRRTARSRLGMHVMC